MSRTYKDKPYKFHPSYWRYDADTVKIPYLAQWKSWRTGEIMESTRYAYMQLPTTKPKKRKAQDTEYHWMSTPAWWTRLMMNKPQRRAGSTWERKAVKLALADLETLDTPSVSRKPHKYYW